MKVGNRGHWLKPPSHLILVSHRRGSLKPGLQYARWQRLWTTKYSTFSHDGQTCNGDEAASMWRNAKFHLQLQFARILSAVRSKRTRLWHVLPYSSVQRISLFVVPQAARSPCLLFDIYNPSHVSDASSLRKIILRVFNLVVSASDFFVRIFFHYDSLKRLMVSRPEKSHLFELFITTWDSSVKSYSPSSKSPQSNAIKCREKFHFHLVIAKHVYSIVSAMEF